MQKSVAAFLPFLLLASTLHAQTTPTPIDRHALVSRHNITLHQPDPFNTLSVGNGDIAFNLDITGLQSFPEFYEKSSPLGTLASWGWHAFPNPNHYTLDDFKMTTVKKHDREFVYPASSTSNPPPDSAWLRMNPHKFGLARIGLDFTKADGSRAAISDLKEISQSLDLWTGRVTSTFTLAGIPVKVETAAHGTRDELATRITSPLLATGKIKLHLAFPYASTSFGPDYQDFTKPDAHTTSVARTDATTATITRTLDDTHYTVATRWSPGATLAVFEPHTYLLATSADTLEFSAAFSSAAPTSPADPTDAVLTASTNSWQNYWTHGGIIDFSATADPRAAELERRLILSQYLLAVHDASSYPPAETGLNSNSWYGKFHMEMYWWHSAHWALWGRPELLERSLKHLPELLPAGQAMAKREGARGVKWSKMTSPTGVESPSGVGPALVWQQPHPIYLAELVYRAKKDRATLDAYKEIVFQTADYIATFVDYDPIRKQYVLGPGVASADEGHTKYDQNLNPAMELGYWKWALQTAQLWRTRLGMEPDPLYAKVIANIAPPFVRNGVYTAVELPEETSPSWMATWLYGALPGNDIDKTAMGRTLTAAASSRTRAPQAAVTWGIPMVAMCAARMNDPDLATTLLTVPYEPNANPFRPNGTTIRRPDQTPTYMPANGGWLAAAAMMAAGWDNNTTPTPGFPKSWTVRHEGLVPMP